MPTYVAFLRAVNIGKRAYPMAELRAAVQEAGFDDVATHIQTGNLRVTTTTRGRAKVAAALERVFEEDRGFAVRTVVFTPTELTGLAADAVEIGAGDPPAYGHYLSLLPDPPTAALARAMEELSRDGERVVVRGRAVHLLYDRPYHEAKVSNAAVEKVLGVATNRNLKVIAALAEKWGG